MPPKKSKGPNTKKTKQPKESEERLLGSSSSSPEFDVDKVDEEFSRLTTGPGPTSPLLAPDSPLPRQGTFVHPGSLNYAQRQGNDPESLTLPFPGPRLAALGSEAPFSEPAQSDTSRAAQALHQAPPYPDERYGGLSDSDPDELYGVEEGFVAPARRQTDIESSAQSYAPRGPSGGFLGTTSEPQELEDSDVEEDSGVEEESEVEEVSDVSDDSDVEEVTDDDEEPASTPAPTGGSVAAKPNPPVIGKTKADLKRERNTESKRRRRAELKESQSEEQQEEAKATRRQKDNVKTELQSEEQKKAVNARKRETDGARRLLNSQTQSEEQQKERKARRAQTQKKSSDKKKETQSPEQKKAEDIRNAKKQKKYADKKKAAKEKEEKAAEEQQRHPEPARASTQAQPSLQWQSPLTPQQPHPQPPEGPKAKKHKVSSGQASSSKKKK